MVFNKDLAMTTKANKNKKTAIALTIALILLVTIASVQTSRFSQSNTRISNEIIINQVPKQSALPVDVTGINETDSLNAINSSYNSSFESLNTNPFSLDTLNSTTYISTELTGYFFPLRDDSTQEQIVGSAILPINTTDIETDALNANNLYDNNSNASLATGPTSLNASDFFTYTYGGYPVQQDSTHLIFSFPDNISQSQIAGSDALTCDAYAIQTMDFDAEFNAPQINALGFDEMVIFATSNTNTYKGTEFGIRMDLQDGLIYGYIQEPNDNYGDVNFKMVELMPNDGIMHHYTLIMLGSEVFFFIDGGESGYLNFPSNTDYSNLSYSICAAVHRFTNGWDSTGDYMIAGNFSLNQP